MAEKNTSTLLIYCGNPCSSRMVQCHKAAHLAMEEVGAQVQIPAGQIAVFFFNRSLTLWLVSVNCILLAPRPLLASRDFFENVFLVHTKIARIEVKSRQT